MVFVSIIFTSIKMIELKARRRPQKANFLAVVFLFIFIDLAAGY